MKEITLLMIIAIVFIAASAFSQPVITENLSEEELMPFCSNQALWQHANIEPEKCLSAAKSCSEKISTMRLDINKATEQLYICVFDTLNIDFAQQ